MLNKQSIGKPGESLENFGSVNTTSKRMSMWLKHWYTCIYCQNNSINSILLSINVHFTPHSRKHSQLHEFSLTLDYLTIDPSLFRLKIQSYRPWTYRISLKWYLFTLLSSRLIWLLKSRKNCWLMPYFIAKLSEDI